MSIYKSLLVLYKIKGLKLLRRKRYLSFYHLIHNENIYKNICFQAPEKYSIQPRPGRVIRV